jgi:transcriptional regulator with XRE-family HTH domain
MSARLPSIELDLPKKLRGDRAYRQAFFLAESSALIAKQLIELRKRRGLNQKQVADALETGQPAISRVERADYRNWSFNTLRRLAEALDARLRVIIEPFEDVLGAYGEQRGAQDSPSVDRDLNELRRIFTDNKPISPKRASVLEDDSTLASESPSPKQQLRSSILDDPTKSSRQRPSSSNESIGATWN